MKWVKWIMAYVFDCVHRHTTWPRCDRTGLDYVCCLDCGRQLPYSTRRMSIVTIEEQLEERAFDGRLSLAKENVQLLPDFPEKGPALCSQLDSGG
jgi:hypothetical protein